MDVQTPAPVHVGLEMSRRTKTGCAVVLVALVVTILVSISIARRHGEESSRKAIDAVYGLAVKDDFAAMEAYASKSVISTLQKAESVNGRVQAFSVMTVGTGMIGRPTGLRVQVTRNGKPYVADVALLDSTHVSVIVEYPKEDWDSQRFDRGIRVIENEGAK